MCKIQMLCRYVLMLVLSHTIARTVYGCTQAQEQNSNKLCNLKTTLRIELNFAIRVQLCH